MLKTSSRSTFELQEISKSRYESIIEAFFKKLLWFQKEQNRLKTHV